MPEIGRRLVRIGTDRFELEDFHIPNPVKHQVLVRVMVSMSIQLIPVKWDLFFRKDINRIV